jgi:hypothetical protein
MHPTTAGTTASRPARPILLAARILATLGLAACGDDEGASAEYEEFCQANLEIDRLTSGGGGDDAAVEAAMTAFVEAAPDDEAREAVQATIDAFMALQGPPDEAFNETYGELVAIVEEECGFNDLSVEAKNYEFSGIGDDLDAGPTLVTFENTANEFHEIMILKRNEGDDTPLEDLLSMEQEEAMAHVTPVGGAFAGPGQTGYTSIDLEEGSYVAVCFIPTGATQEAWDTMMSGGAEPDGAPHAMAGMTHEFEVEA